MIDTHSHLNLDPLFENPELYLKNAENAGVTRMMIVGVNIETSERAIALAKRYPELWAAVGIHPEERGELSVFRTQLSELVKNNRVSAIGECGLDYHSPGDHSHQAEVFRMQIGLAYDHTLPLIIHCRDAYDDLLAILNSGPIPKFVLHCASGSVSYVEEALSMGAYVSFAGNVTYPNAGSLRDLLKVTPLDRVLVETDAPFLSPQTKRGTQNEPANVIDTARFIAEFLGKSYEEIDKITSENALKLFR